MKLNKPIHSAYAVHAAEKAMCPSCSGLGVQEKRGRMMLHGGYTNRIVTCLLCRGTGKKNPPIENGSNNVRG